MNLKKITTILVITLWQTLYLTGCTAVAPTSTVKIANGMDMRLLLPAQTVSETQKITARYRQDQHTLIMQVQASPQQVVMAGLTPTGTRLFSLSFDGKTVESWQSPLFSAPFDGSYVLADFELATLDLAALRSALPADCQLADSTHGNTRERTLRNSRGDTVIRIEYDGKQIRYCHLERDYCLQIDTLQ